jgi:hypothetical protein
MHKCVEIADKALKTKNTQIEPIIALGSKLSCAIGVRTSKVDKTKRGKPVLVCASFCPFCGEKLD